MFNAGWLQESSIVRKDSHINFSVGYISRGGSAQEWNLDS